VATIESDTVSVDLATGFVPTLPPSVAVAPAVDSDLDSESEMAESQTNNQFSPQKFRGLTTENAKDWIRQFENYCTYKEYTDPKKMALFKVLSIDTAAVWYGSLLNTSTNTWPNLEGSF